MKILNDIFPAMIALAPSKLVDDMTKLSTYPLTTGAYQLAKARVIITDTHVIIATDSDSGPSIVFYEQCEASQKAQSRSKDSYATTKNGQMLAFKVDSNCGCGSRLLSWNPLRHNFSRESN